MGSPSSLSQKLCSFFIRDQAKSVILAQFENKPMKYTLLFKVFQSEIDKKLTETILRWSQQKSF